MSAVASISLDLDNQWSYMKTHGDPEWETLPSYLDVAVPRILDFLARRGLTITFFIVGQDAADSRNAAALRAIADAGHEIGNHSFRHEPWLHLYDREALERELRDAHQAILEATGHAPSGFRGPGFSLSTATLEVLVRLGYRYDATVFPNILNPLARAYFFAHSRLSAEERERRKALFGTFRDAFQPVRPFRWRTAEGPLVEVPVTTMPLLRLPFHLSYVLYAARYSRWLALAYFRLGLALCRVTGTPPSILLHPLDFLGAEDCPPLAFFPGMDMSAQRKIRLVDDALDAIQSRYRVVTLREQVEAADDARDLSTRTPRCGAATDSLETPAR